MVAAPKQSQFGNPWFGAIIPLSPFQGKQSDKKLPSLILTEMTQDSKCKQAQNLEKSSICCWTGKDQSTGQNPAAIPMKQLTWKNIKKNTLYFWNVRISTHLSSDSYKWQCGTENPQWSLSLKWKILWQSQWKRRLNLKYNFYHETGKPLVKIHREMEFACEIKMLMWRDEGEEEEDIKGKMFLS